MFKAFLLVGFGGFLGSIARWQFSRWIDHLGGGMKFPVGIFAVNGIGCLLIGLLFGWFATRDGLTDSWRLFAAVGFLGAFTTFSTFGHNTIELFQEGHANLAFINILASVVIGVLAVWLGYTLAK